MQFTVEDITPGSPESLLRQAVLLLVEGFRDMAPRFCPDEPAAERELADCLAKGRICRGARTKEGFLLGWIGGIPQYYGTSWELHPLVVHPEFRRRGLGSLLVKDLAEQAAQRGGGVLYVGTDDENHMTSLAGVDLFDKPWEHIKNIRNFRNHPYEFYQKQGFVIVGVLPDANGPGKPDIFMAKRICCISQERDGEL
jgi:aminoglycoside 6'-N-acetyltransferase I